MKKLTDNPIVMIVFGLIVLAVMKIISESYSSAMVATGMPFLMMIGCFFVLTKSADLFVDSSSGIAKRFGIPKIIIGIFLVGLATTAPELAVSMMSALKGMPEMALGNAVGSVICDDGLALAAAAIFSAAAIPVLPRVLKTAGLFLVGVDILAFLFIAPDQTLGRIEGGILLLLFFLYTTYIIKQQKQGKLSLMPEEEEEATEEEVMNILKLVMFFMIGLAGIIASGEFLIESAVSIATMMEIPETVIAMTLVAFGTSVPEVATCIIAARKNEGELAVGNIIGADILNICWVAGASALAHPLTVEKAQIQFMFPAMLVIVIVMLVLMRLKHRLTKWHGFVLLSLYVVYLVLSFTLDLK